MVSVQEIYFDIGFDRIQNNEMRIEMLFFILNLGFIFCLTLTFTLTLNSTLILTLITEVESRS